MTTRTTSTFEVSRFVRYGLMAAAVASAINLVIFFVATIILNISLLIPPDMSPMPAFMVIVASVFGAVGGTVLLLVLGHLVASPVATFRYIAVAFLIFSLFPPLTMPGLDLGSRLVMVAMHFGAGLPIIAILTTRAKE